MSVPRVALPSTREPNWSLESLTGLSPQRDASLPSTWGSRCTAECATVDRLEYLQLDSATRLATNQVRTRLQ